MGRERTDATDLAGHAAGLLVEVRARRPLVHVLANFVTMQAVASATRAVGALPVMALAGDDATEAAGQADALVLSLGTPTPDRIEAMVAAGRVAAGRGVPIVLDPVGAGATAFRSGLARRMLDQVRVTVVRANRGEAAALLGQAGFVRGVETVLREGAIDGAALARALAAERRCVAAVTGACDHLADPGRSVVVENGHPWLEAVSGAGCMATAVAGAFCAVASDPLLAAASALACFGVAAEIAAARSAGPGTLVPAFIDALHDLTPERARQGTRARTF